MPNLIKTSVRVDIDPAAYSEGSDPLEICQDAFFEAADKIIPVEERGPGWLTDHFFTVRFDDNGTEFTATITATGKKA